MINLAASELNLSRKYISWSHKTIISGPCTQCICLICSATLWLIALWCKILTQGSSIFAYSASDFPLLHWLVWFQVVILLVHSICPDHSLLWYHLLLHLYVPPAEGHWYLSQALLHSLLWPWHQVFSYQPSHLGSGQTMIINKWCKLLSSLWWLVLWQRASMLTNDNQIMNSTCRVGQSIIFIQCNDFVSIVGLLAASLNKRSLLWSVTFHAQWSLEHFIPFVTGSDKLDYYTHSL